MPNSPDPSTPVLAKRSADDIMRAAEDDRTERAKVPLAVQCPVCHQPPGEPCKPDVPSRFPEGPKFKLWPHIARFGAYEQEGPTRV